MNQQNQNLVSSNRTTTRAGLSGLGILVLLVLMGCVFREGIQQPSAQAIATLSPTLVIPTMFIPTPDCGSPTLTIGTTALQIQTVQLAPDGSVSVPANGSGMAYWVEGTDAVLIFFLSHTPENLALVSSLSDGSLAKATWQNCNSMTFALSAPKPGAFGVTYLPDQSTTGINIYLQPDTTGNGFVVSGTLTEEQIVNIGTPVTGSSEIQAEISLLETSTSPDNATLRVGVSVFNFGQTSITLSPDDVSLTTQDATLLSLVLSEPALPKEIVAGATETLYFTFPRPTISTATLKIFNVEYELDGY